MVTVYVRVLPVTSAEHHQLTVYYNDPTSGWRSHSGIPGQSPAEFVESDVRPKGGILPRQHTTGAHEAGHWLGLEHIFCHSNSAFCYGITNGQADDVMGRGEYVSGRDYQPLLDVMHHATGCDWKTQPEGGLRGGSLALAFGVLGAGIGALLGVATGLGAGATAAIAGGLGLVGAFEGFLFGDLR